MRFENVSRIFHEKFGGAPDVWARAPGRVDLMGSHTDYNLGFVLPIALDLACFTACAPSADGRVRVYSENLNQSVEWELSELPGLQRADRWSDYVAGVAVELLRAGYSIAPKNILIQATVPVGSGLSSSAALEVSSALALLEGQKIEPLELAKLCRRAEVDFVGMPAGIMDQYVSIFGREHAAIRIDCRSLDHEAVRLPDGIEIVAVDTMVKHQLAQSAYKERTQECAAAVEAIRSRDHSVESLRDVSLEQFTALADFLPRRIARRARHVVTENNRVEQFVEACRQGDITRMGKLFVESHRSLQHDYEVSCQELDFLVDSAIEMDGVYGARMTGGGFGGCTVNLVRAERVEDFEEKIARAYQKHLAVEPHVYRCKPSAGASEVAAS